MLREVGSENGPSRNSITLSGTLEELDMLRAMVAGVCWLGRPHGMTELARLDMFKPVPDPIDDPMIPPVWATKVPPVGQCTPADLDKHARERIRVRWNVAPPLDPREAFLSPSLLIQHLCGYGWTIESYREQVRTLHSVGFECLRSRRGKDGKFWEAWLLPGLWCAGGPLKEALAKYEGQAAHWQDKTDAAVTWLCRNVLFGTLDVMVQRAAIAVD